jgi:tripartite-type tricarboxylate transporter receptor subunit TctC
MSPINPHEKTMSTPITHTQNFAQRDRRLLLLGLMSAGLPGWALAQNATAMRLVVPFTPGGSTDILARAIGPHLGAGTDLSVVIDNKPGAGGSIGAELVAKAKPDGLTLLMGHIGTMAINPSLYPKLPYDPLKSFEPVMGVARVPNVLVVSAKSDIKTLKDLVDAARARPGHMTYSSGGNGSAAHTTFELLKMRAKIFVSHIPYRGAAPSISDLIAGHVDTTFTGSPALLPHIRSGRLRALAVSSKQRLPTLPDVPTVAESGFPGFEADQWYGVLAPAGTPPAVLKRLNEAANQGLKHPDVLKSLLSEGAVPMGGAPEVFGRLIAAEIPRWREVVKASGMKLD